MRSFSLSCVFILTCFDTLIFGLLLDELGAVSCVDAEKQENKSCKEEGNTLKAYIYAV